METWFGRISLYLHDNTEDKLTTHAAIFCHNREEFESLFLAHITAKGFQVAEFEIVITAIEWLQTYGYINDVMRLSNAVNEFQRVATGDIVGQMSSNKPKANVSYLSINEHSIPPLTNDSDLAVWEKEWIVPELKQLLFAQSEEKTLNTYLIVDAYLRKKISGIFDLEDNFWEIPIKCLFKGESADKLKEVSPYLIDMTLSAEAQSDNSKVSKFHKDFFANHWGKQTGIFIRTTASMDEVWQHLRRFTRVQMQDNKMWVYFRFWQPHIAQSYLTGLATLPEKIATWGRISEDKQIAQWVIEQNEQNVGTIAPIWKNLGDYPFNKKALLISAEEEKPLEKHKVEQFDDKVAQVLFNASSDLGKTQEQFELTVLAVREWANQLGIDGERDIAKLANLALILGYRFFEDERLATLNHKLTDTTQSANDRVNEYTSAIELWLNEIWGDNTTDIDDNLRTVFSKPLTWHKNNNISLDINEINRNYLDVIPAEQLELFAQQCIINCEQQKITSPYAQRCYILIALVYGQYFISDPMHTALKTRFEEYANNDEALKMQLYQFFTKEEG